MSTISPLALVAEVKTTSPFGWHSELSWDELFAMADQYGDVISIHTDPRWDGSLDLIAKARAKTSKPILAKGIHVDDQEIEQALALGADYVLVVDRLPQPKLLPYCWLEPNSLDQLTKLPEGSRAVWNSRDLATGGLKTETFAQARAAWNGWLCQASNIRTMTDVSPAINAILVGTHLPEFIKTYKESARA